MTDQNNWTPDPSDDALDQDNNVDGTETTIDNVINNPDAADMVPDAADSELSDTASGLDAPMTPDVAAAALQADEDYEDNFIEDPQGAVPPHVAVNPSNTANVAAPVTTPPLPGGDNTVPPARPTSTPENRTNVANPASTGNPGNGGNANEANMESRLERLGGEPAPVITPEEFARLQKAGQVHIDERGRVRTARRSDSEADAGVSLRKRRAWYGAIRSY
jgi:hypothetical protein